MLEALEDRWLNTPRLPLGGDGKRRRQLSWDCVPEDSNSLSGSLPTLSGGLWMGDSQSIHRHP